MQGPDGEMGSEGETHLPFPDAVLLGVCGHARRTRARSHIRVRVHSYTANGVLYYLGY